MCLPIGSILQQSETESEIASGKTFSGSSPIPLGKNTLKNASRTRSVGRFIDWKTTINPMMTIALRDCLLTARSITLDESDEVLNVYRQCEDFLALGPVPTASMEMVQKDIEKSKAYGGLFCGIYTSEGKMIGILDYVPSKFEGDPHAFYISLLMIAAPFRSRG